MELVILDPNFQTTDNRIRIVTSLTSSWEAERPSASKKNVISMARRFQCVLVLLISGLRLRLDLDSFSSINPNNDKVQEYFKPHSLSTFYSFFLVILTRLCARTHMECVEMYSGKKIQMQIWRISPENWRS